MMSGVNECDAQHDFSVRESCTECVQYAYSHVQDVYSMYTAMYSMYTVCMQPCTICIQSCTVGMEACIEEPVHVEATAI